MKTKKERISEENNIFTYNDGTFVDLSNIRRVNNTFIWSKSIDAIIHFRCKNNFGEMVDGHFTIINTEHVSSGTKICMKYNSEIYDVLTSSIINANLLKLLHKEFKYKIGDTIINSKINLTIVDRKKISPSVRRYKYHCNKCGYEDWKNEIDFWENRLIGCPVCCIPCKKVVRGINDIETTDKWMVKYFKNKKDIYNHSSTSNQYAELICPDCGKEKRQTIYSLKYDGFACECKTTGFSYPEKFMSQILTQLGIDFISQYNSRYSDWTKKYLYDFYLPMFNTLIETHGKQHYDDVNIWHKTFKEESKNDKDKRLLAINNGISYYIELNCSKSNLLYIKNSIMNSILPSLLCFKEEDIDWDLCNINATSNIVKDICIFYQENKYKETIKDIAKKFKISRDSVRNYLLRGNEIGWCEYNADGRTVSPKKYDNILLIKKDGVILGKYNSPKELCLISKEQYGTELQASTISACARGCYKYNTYKGFSFEYISTQQHSSKFKLNGASLP